MQDLLTIGNKKSKHCIILLHGLTSNAKKFRQVGEYLEKNLREDDFMVLMPTADERFVQWIGEKTNAWFDVAMSGLRGKCDLDGIADSCEQIALLVAKLRQDGKKTILLGGFSQGGAITLCYPLLAETKVDAVFSLSAYLPDILKKRLQNPLSAFLAKGKLDRLIDEDLFSASIKELQELGFVVTRKDYPNLKHEISNTELDNLDDWIKNICSVVK